MSKQIADYFADTAIAIKSSCISSLDRLLTTYTLPTGQIIDAVAINPILGSDVFPPEGTKTGEGIEVVIYYPDGNFKAMLSGYSRSYLWQIYLKQWDLKDNTIEASERLIDALPYQVKNCFRNRQNNLINQPEICKIEVIIGIAGSW